MNARKFSNFSSVLNQMEWGWKFASLLDLTRLKDQSSSTKPAIYCSLMDMREPAPGLAEDILGHGSPTSTRSGDPHCLMYTAAALKLGMWLVTPTWTRQRWDIGITEKIDNSNDTFYHQCKTARRTSYSDRQVSVSCVITGFSITSFSPPDDKLTDHDGLCKIFHGSRIRKGVKSILSISPSVSHPITPVWSVVSCPVEHTIVRCSLVMVFFSDQNFVANLDGVDTFCFAIVRMEDASLTELFELFRELF